MGGIMSKINLDTIRVDMLKKREKIERLEKQIKYLSEKLFYTIECKECGHMNLVYKENR